MSQAERDLVRRLESDELQNGPWCRPQDESEVKAIQNYTQKVQLVMLEAANALKARLDAEVGEEVKEFLGRLLYDRPDVSPWANDRLRVEAADLIRQLGRERDDLSTRLSLQAKDNTILIERVRELEVRLSIIPGTILEVDEEGRVTEADMPYPGSMKDEKDREWDRKKSGGML